MWVEWLKERGFWFFMVWAWLPNLYFAATDPDPVRGWFFLALGVFWIGFCMFKLGLIRVRA
jgi:hypothetical protein